MRCARTRKSTAVPGSCGFFIIQAGPDLQSKLKKLLVGAGNDG